jgi:hypothetical protein
LFIDCSTIGTWFLNNRNFKVFLTNTNVTSRSLNTSWLIFIEQLVNTFAKWYRKSTIKLFTCLVWFMVFNATFNNISVISWRSVLSMEETGVPGEKHWQNLSLHVVSSTPRYEGFELTTLVMIDTVCTVSC